MKKYAFFTSILISSIPLLFLSSIFLGKIQSLNQEKITASIQREIDVTSDNLSDFLEERVGNLKEWSESPILRVAFEFSRPEGLASSLALWISHYPSYEWITVLDKDGKIFASTFKGSVISIIDNDIYTSKIVFSNGGESSKKVGIIIAKISQAKVLNFFSQLKSHLSKIPIDDIGILLGDRKSNANMQTICPIYSSKALVPICASIDKNKFSSEISYLTFTVLCLVLFLISVTFFIVSRSFKKIIEPFNKINTSLEGIASQDYQSVHFNSKIPDLLLIEERFNKVLLSIKESEEVLKLKSHNEALYEISRQVAHDIRSPVAALNVSIEQLSEIPNEILEIITYSTSRINDIANDLLDRSIKSRLRTVDVIQTIQNIIKEKKVLDKNNFIQFNFSTSCKLNPLVLVDNGDLKRIFSNLLNNSIQAFQGGMGFIEIEVKTEKELVVIDIIDNGCGIPNEVIHQIGTKGFSLNNGTGLGFHHAKETLINYGGEISIHSTPQVGTRIKILLPSLCRELVIPFNDQVIIIDDDPIIHDLWRKKFSSLVMQNQVLYFHSPEDFIKHSSEKDLNFFGLVDYEFRNSNLNGLDIVAKFNKCVWYMVSNRFDDQSLLTKCLEAKIRLVPKNLLPEISISKGV
jgi:signal transduction histidine kinase